MASSKIGAEKLLAVLDRPIAFQRVFVAVAGSVAGAVMLSQMVYWQRRASAPGGWWYKSREDWTEEVGLSRREQETARAAMRAHGVLEERTKGIPRRLYYRLNVERLAELVGAMAEEAAEPQQVTCDQQAGTPTPIQQARSDQQAGRKRTSKQGGNVPTNSETTSETSSETTGEKEPPAKPSDSRSPDFQTVDEPAPAPMPPHGRPPIGTPPVKPMRVTQEELDEARSTVCRALDLPMKAWLPAHEFLWTKLWRESTGDLAELVKVFKLARRQREAAGHVGVTLRYVEQHYGELRSLIYQPSPAAIPAPVGDSGRHRTTGTTGGLRRVGAGDERHGSPSAAKARGWCPKHPGVGLGPSGCSRCNEVAA